MSSTAIVNFNSIPNPFDHLTL